jgi:nucleotidyltransferase substrate binding protein (TIGR01987 family)
MSDDDLIPLPPYVNFEAALGKLLEFTRLYDGSEIHRAGLIQAFEFTFEQCWKTLQKKAGGEGVVIASPKKALEWAMAAALFPPTEEAAWLTLLKDRNLTSHTYREKMAREIAENILRLHAPAFSRLLLRLKAVP